MFVHSPLQLPQTILRLPRTSQLYVCQLCTIHGPKEPHARPQTRLAEVREKGNVISVIMICCVSLRGVLAQQSLVNTSSRGLFSKRRFLVAV